MLPVFSMVTVYWKAQRDCEGSVCSGSGLTSTWQRNSAWDMEGLER